MKNYLMINLTLKTISIITLLTATCICFFGTAGLKVPTKFLIKIKFYVNLRRKKRF